MQDAPRYREAGPDRLPAVLRDLVECAWHAEVPATRAHPQRVLPDGCMDLLVVGGRIVVAGPDTAAHVADQPPGTAVTGLRFRTGALPGLLGVPAAELRDTREPLDAVLPDRPCAEQARGRPGASRGRARTPWAGCDATPWGAARPCGATEPAACGRTAGLVVLTELVERLRADDRTVLPAPLPRAALDRLARGATAAAVADELGCTVRTLHRRCVETAGYGPSVLRRILRFRAATRLLYAGVAPAEAAARTGYADQPHLSREVRALSGLSPTDLASR